MVPPGRWDRVRGPEPPTPPEPSRATEPAPPGPPASPPAAAAPAYVASCNNCTRFVESTCALGRILPPGKLLCGDYEITPAFRDELVRVMMKDILTQAKDTATRVTKLRAAQRLWN